MENKNTLDFLLIRSIYFVLVVIGVVSTSNLNVIIPNMTLSGIDLLLSIVIALATIIRINNKGYISLKLFYFLCLIFFSLIVSLIFKSYSIFLLYLCGIAALNFSSKELVRIYYYAILIGIAISVILGISRIIDFSNLGFDSKNTIGFYLFSEYLLYFYLNRNITKVRRCFILVILFFIEFFIIKDRTGGLLSIIYLIIILIGENSKIIKNKFMITFPFVLTILSMFLGENFTLDSGWMSNLNKALSNRILFWNFNLNQYGVKFFPQSIETISVQLNDGSFTVNYLDNGYLNFLIGIGYFQTIILLLIISIAIKNIITQHKDNDLVIIIIFLLYAFTEKIIFSPTCCILFPLCFLEICSGCVNEINQMEKGKA